MRATLGVDARPHNDRALSDPQHRRLLSVRDADDSYQRNSLTGGRTAGRAFAAIPIASPSGDGRASMRYLIRLETSRLLLAKRMLTCKR